MFPLIFLPNSIDRVDFPATIYLQTSVTTPSLTYSARLSLLRTVHTGFDPLLYCACMHLRGLHDLELSWESSCRDTTLLWKWEDMFRPRTRIGRRLQCSLSFRFYPFSTFHTPSNAPARFATVHCSYLLIYH
jgi:hypothetical protein